VFLNLNIPQKLDRRKVLSTQSAPAVEIVLLFITSKTTKFINQDSWLFMIWVGNGMDIVLIKQLHSLWMGNSPKNKDKFIMLFTKPKKLS
jgi:hypothetical protein